MNPDGVCSGTPLVYSNCFAGLEHRLLADDAGAAHLLAAAVGIGNAPVARLELHRLACPGW